MYLTMISIVQGVALSLLVAKAPELTGWGWTEIFAFTWTLDSILPLLSKGAYIVTTFLLIVLTWHSYFWLAAIARWVPTILDSVLFFVFGAFEFMLIDSLSHPDSFAWFYFFASIGLLSAIQYKYNSKRLDDTKVKKTENNVLLIDIWHKDVEDLGGHVVSYKKDRGKRLLIKSICFIAALILLDKVLPNSWIFWPLDKFQPLANIKFFANVKFSECIKFFLILYILKVHLGLIFEHVETQKESLEKLTQNDSVDTSYIFNNIF
jgi:hypothetical protein